MSTAAEIRLLLVLLILTPTVAWPQDLEAEARAMRPADPSELSKAADDDLERRAHEALDGVRRAYRARDIKAQRPELRRRLEESLGTKRLPWPPDLQATLTGRVEREGYRIDKLGFQTLPGVWASAHLYVPNRLPEPAPAVLLSSAHAWEEGKAHPDAQAFAINMVRMGFVVLVFDALGRGERVGSPADHRRSESLLVGVTQQGLVQYETRCALQYLRSRREVDPGRIGMTGADGGGFATWIAAALDENVKAAVVVDDTTDFHEQIRYLRSLDEYELDDHCPLVPGIFRYANNHELLALVAPRPVLIVQSPSDESYPVSGARAVYEYGTEIYTTLHERRGVAFVEDESNGRGFQKAKREAAYGWFLHWLADGGKGKPIEEPDTQVEPADSPELATLPEGRTAPTEPAWQTLLLGKPRISVLTPCWTRNRPGQDGELDSIPPSSADTCSILNQGSSSPGLPCGRVRRERRPQTESWSRSMIAGRRNSFPTRSFAKLLREGIGRFGPSIRGASANCKAPKPPGSTGQACC